MAGVILLFLASLIAALAAGAVLLVALRWWHLPLSLLVAADWLIGNSALALERLLLAQAGLPWNLATLGLPWLALGVIAGWRLWKEHGVPLRRWTLPFRASDSTRLVD